ncbi:Rhs element Vgr protein [Pseudomonas syringae pv. tomato]|uniref:Rhs element Vgr protein n=1 Tax=Pseudomonas syringae pv. tomato (strain ATCC BAA-871 / DC3000) TaxID=223283 RepID=Q87ZE8_PSESM|nr:hypothetical protein PSPTO_3481 [Pseudomonas syringae pv. tomato str. DC3000]KPB94943.1 Uncharacterized protein AC502_0724 [Pseudomonas syringae pv. maculicola]KPY86032.1 Rhs element Vgr protein [Pseudomonas syringae pv. tomato]MBW8019687.1 hypothetical protein [Pseudomonas syringae pv. tomato]
MVVQDTEYDLEKLIGQPVSLAILCDDGSPAQRHRLVESMRYLGNDDGLHNWQLVLRRGLACLSIASTAAYPVLRIE